MENKSKIRLTSAEISMLWTQFINDTASICMIQHFLEKVEDEEVRPILEFALNASKKNISFLTEFFKMEKFPVPVGFTEQDVHSDAPKLFSDTFVLMYLRNMSVLGMAAGSVSLGFVTRPDVVDFFKNVSQTAIGLQDLTRSLMLKQGTYIKSPYVTLPDKVDFVQRQKFLAGLLGDVRPLTVHEITMLFNNIQTNAIGKTIIIGFAQTAQKKEVKQYLMRGKQIAQKHIDLFSDKLKKEDLPAPMIWDSALSDSTKAVFSDKLMMFHVASMNAAGLGNYGTSMAGSPRRDLALLYASLIPEVALYAEDGANLMIKNSWMEEPPQTDDRNQLIKGD
ncbi:DUF3231 family protein [Bacillus sp. JJ1122]|uniref:DUF3231 family protein n=1 Tax=Bacillus sp. JJ1122 TaxID=3122951 RepID=UPI002FFFA628